MPISVEELRKAKRPLDERIIEFLSKSPSSAYTLVELIKGVEGYEGEDDSSFALLMVMERTRPGGLQSRYEAAIKNLIASGAVEVAALRGTEYYARATKASP